MEKNARNILNLTQGKILQMQPMHYGIKAMGAMTLRISELYLSFSPHPNISDGKGLAPFTYTVKL